MHGVSAAAAPYVAELGITIERVITELSDSSSPPCANEPTGTPTPTLISVALRCRSGIIATTGTDLTTGSAANPQLLSARCWEQGLDSSHFFVF